MFENVLTTLEDGSTICDLDPLVWLRSQNPPFAWKKSNICLIFYETSTFRNLPVVDKLQCMDFIRVNDDASSAIIHATGALDDNSK